MPAAFPHPPDNPSGDWVVRLPPESALGQLLLYGSPVTVEPVDHYRWPCSESSLPLHESSGYDHQLTSLVAGDPGYTMGFGYSSMRSDSAGSAVLQLTGEGGSGMILGWTPYPLASVDGWWTVAALIGHTGTTLSTNPGQYIGVNGIARVAKGAFFGFVPPWFELWNGSAWVDIHDESGTPTTGLAVFQAIRISPAGVWKTWLGDVTATGTFASYDPDESLSQVAWLSNDNGQFKVQEIHVWNRETTDADVEAVRVSLLGA